MKDPIQIDWRQYPIGTPAVFRKGTNTLELIWKDNTVFIFLDTLSKRTIQTVNADGSVFEFKTDPGDILLPWSHAIADGYNPDKLTNEQVGEGYRLVNTKNEPFNSEAEVWWNSNIGWLKTTTKSTYTLDCNYRLPIKPKLSAKDFPPGTVVRFAGQYENSWQSVIRVTQHEFHLADSSILAFDKSLSMATSMYDVAMQRSLDGGKTWLSC